MNYGYLTSGSRWWHRVGWVATDFATRSLQRTMDSASVYDESIQKVFDAFGKRGGNYLTAGQIAEVID